MLLDILIILVVIIVILLIAFFFVFSDSKLIFWYLISKKKYKYKMLRLYKKNDQEILFLGSLHDMHFGFEEYHFCHLKAVLLNYKPDVLLVESRQEEIDVGNIADGPIEMFYLSMIARDLDIPVIGVDWFDHNIHKPGTTIRLRDEHILKRIETGIIPYKKPMVVVGATHLLIEHKMLRKNGYSQDKLSREQLDTYFKTNETTIRFHKDTVMYLKKRIDRELAFMALNNMDENWKKATERSIHNLKRFIKAIEEGKYLLDE